MNNSNHPAVLLLDEWIQQDTRAPDAGERQLQVLGVFVHGMLTFGHLLGIVFNARRKNWFDVSAHSAAMTYDVWAAMKHARRLQ